MPGDGRTMITVGGKEIFHDEIIEWIKVLDAVRPPLFPPPLPLLIQREQAKVSPVTLLKSLGAHDSYLFDYVIPGVWRTRSKGPDAVFDYGLRNMCDFMQEVDILARRKFWEEKRATKLATVEVEVPVVDEKVEVMVEKKVEKKVERNRADEEEKQELIDAAIRSKHAALGESLMSTFENSLGLGEETAKKVKGKKREA